jgi:hypothetical protein
MRLELLETSVCCTKRSAPTSKEDTLTPGHSLTHFCSIFAYAWTTMIVASFGIVPLAYFATVTFGYFKLSWIISYALCQVRYVCARSRWEV